MPIQDDLLTQLRRAVETQIDSLNQRDSEAYADTMRYMQFVVLNLQYADQGMMQWMRNVKKIPEREEAQFAGRQFAGRQSAGRQSADQNEMAMEVADTTNIVQIQQSQKTAIEQVKQQIESKVAIR
ncbi:hypothetical protein [Tunicatimonas pelagia]|uniref:hypothetical protein n=1 Tax=Tunicatimonas pelagia TaxID=931531 RepID=UPI002665F42F|nr:hypothetical protein [Tunicatimonas pelagia]WKN44139.1 hypothetical protein P0M28_04050 [Tunicatimonas pelagia]